MCAIRVNEKEIVVDPEPRLYVTQMECGCIVTTLNHNIKDWKPQCAAHRKAFENSISSHDRLIEDMCFEQTRKDNK